MRIDRIFKLSFWKFELKQYKEMLKIDEVFNATFRGEHDELSFKEKHSIEYKIVKLYRKYTGLLRAERTRSQKRLQQDRRGAVRSRTAPDQLT